MTLHRYRSLWMTFCRIMGLFWALLPVFFVIKAWLDVFTSSPAAMPIDILIPLSFGLLLIGVPWGMAVINSYPDIIVRDDGLSVKCFFFKWFFVPWEDVISAKPHTVSVGKRRTYLVQVKNLTIIHRLINFLQCGSLQPGFMISPGIDGYHELLRVIREHIGEA